jgi:hypothetical protein
MASEKIRTSKVTKINYLWHIPMDTKAWGGGVRLGSISLG